MVNATISCSIYPSEDPSKVRDAVLKLFPSIEIGESDGAIKGVANLDNFSKLIRKQEILDSTRMMMHKGMHNHEIVLHLNKQVATVGKVSFAEPSSILGTIKVSIIDEDPENVIDYIAPMTVDGREVTG